MKKRILVVDDEELIRDLFGNALCKAGFNVTTAGSSEEALVIMHDNRFHLVFLDLNLPGMDGIKCCKIIREKDLADKCIAVTGYVSVFNYNKCKKAGFDGFLKKPVKTQLLISAAETELSKIDSPVNQD
jgi:two-component system secretion sensor histidine kinase SsrA